MKKGKQPLLYTLSSVASWAVDTGGFFLLSLAFGAVLGDWSEPVCNIAARAISSLFNFSLNRRLVFQDRGPCGKALLKYYCLAVPQLLVSTLLLTFLVNLHGIETSHGATVVKVIVDGCLFVASFFIQKYWVFSHRGK